MASGFIRWIRHLSHVGESDVAMIESEQGKSEKLSAFSGGGLFERFYYQLKLIQEIDRRLLRSGRDFTDMQYAPHDQFDGSAVCDVGVLNAVDPAKDALFSTYSEHIHLLICGGDITEYLTRAHAHREYDVRPDGPGGATKTQITDDDPCNRLDLVAGNAISAALAFKLTGSSAISVAFLNEEMFLPEQLSHYFSVASLWSLPVLYVLNTKRRAADDSWTFSTAREVKHTVEYGETLATRSIIADDVLKVYAFACAAAAHVRSNCRPLLLRLITVPLCQSASGALHEAALWKMASKLDPLQRSRIENAVSRRVEDALQAVGFWGA